MSSPTRRPRRPPPHLQISLVRFGIVTVKETGENRAVKRSKRGDGFSMLVKRRNFNGQEQDHEKRRQLHQIIKGQLRPPA